MRRLVVLGVLAAGCSATPDLDSIVVDISANCNEAVVQMVTPDLASLGENWVDVHAAASDGPGTAGAWLLVETDDPDGFRRLSLQHWSGEGVDTIETIEELPNSADSMILRPGPTPGEAYLIRRSIGVFRLWHVDVAADGLVTPNPGELAFFPPNDSSCRDEDGNAVSCDVAEWFRDLVFLRGDPFLVSVPPASPNVSTGIWVGPITSALRVEPGTENRLNFEPQCDMAFYEEFIACESIKEQTKHPSIEAVAVTTDPRPSEAKMLMFRETVIGETPPLSPDVVLVELRLDDDGPIGQLISLVTTEGERPVPGPPAGIAIDDFAGYLVHATNRETARMLRVANGETTFESLEYEAPFGGQLVQLDADLAFVEPDGSTLIVTKVFPDSPDQSQTSEYDAGSRIRAYQPAGPGAALLHLEDKGPDLIRIVCASDDEL